jgi:hypothetical protein
MNRLAEYFSGKACSFAGVESNHLIVDNIYELWFMKATNYFALSGSKITA